MALYTSIKDSEGTKPKEEQLPKLSSFIQGAQPENTSGLYVPISKSTAPTVAPGASPIQAFKTAFLEKKPVRPQFALPGQEEQIRGAIPAAIADITARTIEAPVRFAATTAANVRKIISGRKTGEPGKVKLPFEASRLGFEEPGRELEDTGTRFFNKLDELDVQDKAHPTKNLLKAFWQVAIPDIFDAFIAGDAATAGARATLKATRFDPIVDKSLQQLGLKGKDVSVDAVKEQFVSRGNRLKAQGKFSELNDLARATNIVMKNLSGKGLPRLNLLGRTAEDVARVAVSDITKGITPKPGLYKPIGEAPVTAELPGFRARPGQPAPVGLSTQEIEPVGFGKDKPKKGDIAKTTDETLIERRKQILEEDPDLVKFEKEFDDVSFELEKRGLIDMETGELKEAAQPRMKAVDENRIEELKQSIAEGENLLSTGKSSTGKKLTSEELLSISQSVRNAEKKLEAEEAVGRIPAEDVAKKKEVERTEAIARAVEKRPAESRLPLLPKIPGAEKSIKELATGKKPSKKFELNPIEKASREFEENGSAVIAIGDGKRVVMKDEGDFIVVRMGTGEGKLVSTDEAEQFPERTFRTKEEAFEEVRKIYAQAKALEAKAEKKFDVGQAVQFNGKEYTITEKIKVGNEEKFQLTPTSGKGQVFWTNSRALESAGRLDKQPTQTEAVKEAVAAGPKSAKEIAEETKILEPNVRRILGVGAKDGTFERVDKGVYVLKKGGQDIAYIHTGDALDVLPKLVEDGFKADMIFLDIPYSTKAVRGGNRGVKYDLVSTEQFNDALLSLKEIVKDKFTPVFYMFSNAKSGLAEMEKYNELFADKFKPVARGEYTKLQQDGVTRVRNMRGDIIEPEGIIVGSISGELNPVLDIVGGNLDFKLVRPKGYQTEKPAEMIRKLIEMSTKEGDVVLDPFAGSGVTVAESVKAGRVGVGIEKSERAVEQFIKPRVEQAAKRSFLAKNEPEVKVSDDSLDPRNFNTLEEFVRAQGETVYRGGDTAIDTSRGGGRGISVSNKETAGTFTPPKGGIVDEAILPKTAKILKEGDIPKNLQDAYLKEAKVLADPNNFSSTLQKSVIEKQQVIIDYARKNGFDAVEFPFEKEIRVVKPNVLKTKSQLTDIWNKAQGKKPILPRKKPATADEARDTYWKDVIEPQIGKGETIDVAGDNMKEYFGKDFDPSRSDIYAKASYEIIQRLIKDPRTKSFGVLIGGPGSGKTEFLGKPIKTNNSTDVLYETTFSSEKGVRKLLDLMLEHNKNIELQGIVANRENAWNFTLGRGKETGRFVTREAFDKRHDAFPRVLSTLLEDGSINQNHVSLYDFRNITDADTARNIVTNKRYSDNPLALLKEIVQDIDNDVQIRQPPQPEASQRSAERALDTGGGGGRREVSPSKRPDTAADVGARDERILLEKVKKTPFIPDDKIREVANLIKNKDLTEEQLGQAETLWSIASEALELNPARQLSKYARKTGEEAGTLGEVSGKPGGGEWERRGDDIAKTLNYEDSETAREAFLKYRKDRESLDEIKTDLRELREKSRTIRKGEKLINIAMSERRFRIRALQAEYDLTDAEIAPIRKSNVSAMSSDEFLDFMKNAEGRAQQISERKDALIQLKGTIFEKEFIKYENLQKALELPSFDKMTLKQIEEFDKTLQQFKQGDEFLGPRQIQTVKNTDLGDIKTYREALEGVKKDIEKNTGHKVTDADLKEIRVSWLDKFTYDSALARKNPFYNYLVAEKNRAFLNANARFLERKNKINDLLIDARKSRTRGFLQRAIPTDEKVFAYLEADDASKTVLMRDMTEEEIRAAEYIRTIYAEARDYLVQHEVLKKFRTDYITHIRRGFLEAWREDGVLSAVKETFQKYKQDEAVFNILDTKTGDILPLEKFFQFSMRRSGELQPTKNVARAVNAYFSAFEKKIALDSIVPKIDIYTHVLTPKKFTPRGLEFDDSLKRFVRQWVNTKKGRVTDAGFVKPGDPVDWILRTGVAFTRAIDLGFSIPIGVATSFGEQITTIVPLGFKNYALGVQRLATRRGREITDKYPNFVGEPFIERFRDAGVGASDKFFLGMFSLFQAASRRANQIFLLGSMSADEFAKGAINTTRLAELQQKMGRYRVVEGAESVIGATSVGGVATQYKKWAVPVIVSTYKNTQALLQKMRTEGPKKAIQSEEGMELFRSIILTGSIGLGTYAYFKELEDKKDRTFSEEIVFKSARDALTLIGALDPAFITNEPRLMKFVGDLGTAISNIAKLEETKEGELKGPAGLKRALTPSVVRQLVPKEEKKKPSGGPLPELPKLPKLPGLPKL